MHHPCIFRVNIGDLLCCILGSIVEELLCEVAYYRKSHIKLALLVESVAAEIVEPGEYLVVFLSHLQTDGIGIGSKLSRVHSVDDRKHRVIIRNFLGRHQSKTFFDDFLSLLLVALGNEFLGKARHHATDVHNAYLATVVFLDDYIGLFHTSPFKLVHHIVVHTLGVDFASLVGFGLHLVGHNAVSKTLEPHILVEAEIIVRAATRSEIHRTLPIVGGEDVHNHKVALGEIVFGNVPTQFTQCAALIALVQGAAFQAVLLVDGDGNLF